MENKDTGLLINKQDAELHRGYFEEMVTLLGVIALHRPIKEGMKERDLHGELLDDIYDLPKPVGCIFDEHPNIWTMRKLGWNAERNEDKSIIHVPYNLNVQAGNLFIIPDAIDNSKGRVFQVVDMSTTMIYPASIACQIAPYIKSTFPKAASEDFSHSNFNVLKDNEGDD